MNNNSYSKWLPNTSPMTSPMNMAGAAAGIPSGVPSGMPTGISAGIPTGVPTGPSYAPFPTLPAQAPMPSMCMGGTAGQTAGASSAVPGVPGMMVPISQAGQPVTTVDSVLYTPGFLRTQIGRVLRVEFLIGTSMLVDRMGTLVAVGASYIILQEIESDDLLLCDMYSIKFVRIYY